MRNILAAALFLCLATSPLNAGEGEWGDLMRGDGIVVDHQPHPFGGPASDTSYRLFPSPHLPERWQWLADDFTIQGDATIRRIGFWGFYGDNIQPVGEEAFRVRFYAHRVGSDLLPGNMLYEDSFLNPTKNATGVLIPVSGAPEEFFYQVELTTPFEVAAHTQYWLEVVQVGDIDSRFRWEFSINADFNGHAFNNDNTAGVWESTAASSSFGDTAFQLSTVPEPTTATLLLSTYVLCRRRGRRCQ